MTHFFACLGHWTIDEATLSRRRTVPTTKNGDAFDTWTIMTNFPYAAGNASITPPSPRRRRSQNRIVGDHSPLIVLLLITSSISSHAPMHSLLFPRPLHCFKIFLFMTRNSSPVLRSSTQSTLSPPPVLLLITSRATTNITSVTHAE